MPRRRNRTERRRIERENAEELGDDYRFTNDPQLAADRRERRRQRREELSERWHDFHRGKWTQCMVPECKFQVPKLLNLTSGLAIPICSVHQVAVWEHVNESLDDPDISESREALRARRDAIRLEEEAKRAAWSEEARRFAAEDRRDLDLPGDVYYVRVGSLVKVGWTTDLYRRIRAYGADAELLVHYPGTRRDETNLHRNLAPSRAKGREWYHDDPIIRAFVANAVRQYGPPQITDFGWTKPKHIVAGRRALRTA